MIVQAAGIIVSIAFARRVVAGEACAGQLNPTAGGIGDPLIAVIGETVLIALFRFEVLEKRMQMGEPGMGRGAVPGGDEQPAVLFGCIEPGGEAGMVGCL